MKRVIAHWTAGSHTANDIDKQHYHMIIEGSGKRVPGKWPIKANSGPVKGGKYAAHTLNCNSDSIGVSMACMGGNEVSEKPFIPGKWPMTRTQFLEMCKYIAECCITYNIPVTPATVLSHAEVQGTLGIKQRGKWDFTRLAFDPTKVGAKQCGDHMRETVRAYMKGGVPAEPAKPVVPTKPAIVIPPAPAPEPARDDANWFVRLLRAIFG